MIRLAQRGIARPVPQNHVPKGIVRRRAVCALVDKPWSTRRPGTAVRPGCPRRTLDAIPWWSLLSCGTGRTQSTRRSRRTHTSQQTPHVP